MDPDTLKNVGWLVLWGVAFFAMMRFGCGAHVTRGHGATEGTAAISAWCSCRCTIFP